MNDDEKNPTLQSYMRAVKRKLPECANDPEPHTLHRCYVQDLGVKGCVKFLT